MLPANLREILGVPWWIGYGPLLLQPLIAALVAFVAMRATVWLVSWPLRSLPADAHWTERARRAWPVQFTPGLVWACVPAAVWAMPYPGVLASSLTGVRAPLTAAVVLALGSHPSGPFACSMWVAGSAWRARRCWPPART